MATIQMEDFRKGYEELETAFEDYKKKVLKNTIADRIKILLEKSKLSVTECALAADVSRQSLAHYISGKTEPPIGVVVKLADYFAVPVDLYSRKNRFAGEHDI